MSYRLTNDQLLIVRIEDGAFIPADPSNVDYQQYLAWCKQGNSPASVDPAPFAWPALSPKQIRLQLFADGNLSKVQPAIDALLEPLRTTTQISWDHASEYLHDHPLVAQMAPAIGYDTPEKMQAFFAAACQR